MKRMSNTAWARSAAVVAALAGTATGVAMGAEGSSAQTATHRITVTNRQIQDRIIDGIDVATDRDTHNGVVVGYDVTSCRVSPRTHLAVCDVALAMRGGILYAHSKINVETGRGSGTVTGGTRGYRGATGSVTVAMSHITIQWSN
jgi:hypothetical protein